MARNTAFQRFVEKIKPPKDPVRDCWVWIGAKNRKGYGDLWVDGQMRRAHRYSFDISPSGPLASGMQIDHVCRNRSCVNPYHLEQVTSRENTSRGLPGALRPGKSSRFVGVSWLKRDQKWRASVVSNGKSINLGHFDNEEDAAKVYRDFIGRSDAR